MFSACFRNKLVVNKVERDQKTQRALKALNVLYNMQAFTDEGGKDDDADPQSLEMDIRRLDRAGGASAAHLPQVRQRESG